MSEVKLDANGLVTPSISLGDNTLSSEGDKLLWNGEEFKSGAGGHSVGEQWVSMDGTIPFGGLPFLGQVVSKETYIQLYNWVESNGRFKTEAEWQTLYTANNGNVSFYAKVGDNTFRLPSFKGYLKANETAGGYIKEGLPNITGSVKTGSGSGSTMNGAIRFSTGAFYPDTATSCTRLMGGGVESTVEGIYSDFKFDASRSSSIYGKSTHVTPETNTILVGVYAFNTIVSESDIELNSIRQRIDELETLSKHAVGEQWISMDGTIPHGGVPFNGQILNISDYQALYNWAKDNNLIKTESEWQTLKTNNNSNVAYYSDYSSTQFRMPLFRGYLKADSGSGYIKQGLPNITGTIQPIGGYHTQGSGTGAFVDNGSGGSCSADGNAAGCRNMKFDASRSSSIYGRSSNVTPETSKTLVGVYAFNTVVNAAVLDATDKITSHILVSIDRPHIDIGYPYSDASGALIALRSVNYANNPGSFELFAKDATTQKVLTGKPDGTLVWDSKPIVVLIASWRSGTSWYRKYSDGWIEQGGRFTYSQTNSGHAKLSFHTSFSNTNYQIVGSGYRTDGSPNQGFATFRDFNTSYCNTAFWDDNSSNPGIINWYACGY